MKKNLFVSCLLLSALTLALPAQAQRLTPQSQNKLQHFEQAFTRQIPFSCWNGFCFQNQMQALSFCQGFAQAAGKTASIPRQAATASQDTLAFCQQTLKTAPRGVCPSAQAQQEGQEQGRQHFFELLSAGYQAQGEAAAKFNYTDGYRQMGQAVAETYKDGYQNMAEGYKNANYTDGYRQMGQAVAKTYKDGYQNMGEGYKNANYTDGYRQILQAIKNFFKEGCRAKAQGDLRVWQEWQKKYK